MQAVYKHLIRYDSDAIGIEKMQSIFFQRNGCSAGRNSSGINVHECLKISKPAVSQGLLHLRWCRWTNGRSLRVVLDFLVTFFIKKKSKEKGRSSLQSFLIEQRIKLFISHPYTPSGDGGKPTP
jgi:hypothetical protein